MSFSAWGIVTLADGRTLLGQVTEEAIAGGGMLRVTTPMPDGVDRIILVPVGHMISCEVKSEAALRAMLTLRHAQLDRALAQRDGHRSAG